MEIKRIMYKFAIMLISLFYALENIVKKCLFKNAKKNFAILDIEFFHQDAGGFGGYGKTAKNITDHFNSSETRPKVEIILTRSFKRPTTKFLHNTNVIIAPDFENSNIINAIKYARMLNKRYNNFLMTVEYCTDYQYSIFFMPITPLLIWIHDPRPMECLKKISTCSLEVLANSKTTSDELMRHDKNIKDSLQKVIKLSKIFGRKIIFAATANVLIERAKKLYDLPDMEATILPPPVTIPSLDSITFSKKPSVCFLGRWDPIKRPRTFFELAKIFKEVDFLVAGQTHFPEIMEPIKRQYSSIQNLKFLGHIGDKEKDEILRNTWVIINTSIHEALPVSFLESFSYGKPIISCQNPDGMVERFGEYTGELLGDGYDERTIDAFSSAIERMLSNSTARMNKGMAARKFVEENYSHKKFEEMLNKILKEINR